MQVICNLECQRNSDVSQVFPSMECEELMGKQINNAAEEFRLSDAHHIPEESGAAFQS